MRAVDGRNRKEEAIMIRLNRRKKVAGTPATPPGRTSAEKVRSVAMAQGSTPKRAVVIGFLAAAMIVSMSPLAGAHGGDADKVHACVVSSSGSLRIVGAGESCRNGETSLDWSVGSGIGTGTIRGELHPAPDHATGDIALGTVSGQGDNDDPLFGDNGNISGNLGLNTVGRRNLVNDAVDATKLADGSITATKLSWSFLGDLVTESEIQWLLGPGSISTNQLAGSDWDADPAVPGVQTVIGAVTSEKIADGTIAARDLDHTLVQLLEALQEKVAALETEVAALRAG